MFNYSLKQVGTPGKIQVATCQAMCCLRVPFRGSHPPQSRHTNCPSSVPFGRYNSMAGSRLVCIPHYLVHGHACLYFFGCLALVDAAVLMARGIGSVGPTHWCTSFQGTSTFGSRQTPPRLLGNSALSPSSSSL